MQAELNVYPLPSFLEPSTTDFITVVIDVLRATTTIIHAVQAGAIEVVPLLDPAEARRRKAESPSGTAILGGERHGVLIEGFDLGNSPQQYTPEIVGEKKLFFTTTNGTVAMHAARNADSIFPAGFVNASAIVDRIKNRPRIGIVCAGTDGAVTEEDFLLAGCLVHRLQRLHAGRWKTNSFAESAKEIWQGYFCSGRHETVDPVKLVSLLRKSRGAVNLLELGLDADIEAAARIDSISAVPELDPKTMMWKK